MQRNICKLPNGWAGRAIAGSKPISACIGGISQCPAEGSNARCFATLRRQRQYAGRIKVEGNTPYHFGKLEEPFAHKEKSMEEYLKKTSLSPWTPIPDVVARKMFDMSEAKPEDIHVDLGSGDGRVNFHAIDYGVKKSIGIDIDESIVAVARERLMKRHPQPDLEFIVADLLDPNHPAWEKVQEATIITMYFAEEGLKLFRPLLETKLVGRECKVITCGYEMPGWDSRVQEVVLGTQIHMYHWGGSVDDDMEFIGDDILQEPPEELFSHALESNKFQGSNVIDKTGKYPLRGFNPDIFDEEEEEEDWEFEESDDEEENKKEEVQKKSKNSKPKVRRSACSK